MSKIETVKSNWSEIIAKLMQDKQELAQFLRFSAGMYKQSFSDAALIYHQNPNATKVATLETWNKLGRLVNKGEHSIAVFGEDSADRLEGALERGAAIFVRDKNLAVKVCEYMKLPDWSNFRSQVELAMGTEIVCLSGDTLSGLRDKYLHENRCIALSQKVNEEYSKFIADMKKEPADVIIESAYEIVSKDNINMYCQEYNIELSEKQFAALMSSKNTLDEVYREWCDNGEWHGIDDIGLALEETADRIQISLDRNIAEKKTTEIPENISAEKQAVKPKNKSR